MHRSDIALNGARVTVLGLGRSGVAAARLLAREGARVTAIDDNADAATDGLPHDVATLTGGRPEAVAAALAGADLIVLSPGVPRNHPALAAAEAAGVPVIAEVELAWRYLSAPLIAITGSNGKSTVTTWVGHVLQGWKSNVFVGGNLGEPLCEAALAGTGWDFVVAELSSFQLETITSLAPTVAALLNTSPDHLDRYAKVSDYYQAKFRVFEFMTGGHALLNEADASTPLVVEHYLKGAAPVLFNRSRPGDGVALADGVITLTGGGRSHAVCRADELAVTGAQNVENAEATAAICLLAGCPLPTVTARLKTFTGLPHRMQTVAEKHGVRYIDDSKATNPGAVIKALEGAGQVTLLLGGRDKGCDLLSLREHVFLHCPHVIAFGEAAERFRIVLQGHPDASYAETLREAVALAAQKTPQGGQVLLSPACASFDEFKGYAHRGDCFRQYVEALP
ncbi:MAG: UDP-N-acetylmuramoyl-L-alanine--D-glutamate ligase [Nitrospirae bacterium]|nr:UDP-N-acetylmuramoyl-L-alanine--D-glutamate ligase [Nitrospirota bacterium]